MVWAEQRIILADYGWGISWISTFYGRLGARKAPKLRFILGRGEVFLFFPATQKSLNCLFLAVSRDILNLLGWFFFSDRPNRQRYCFFPKSDFQLLLQIPLSCPKEESPGRIVWKKNVWNFAFNWDFLRNRHPTWISRQIFIHHNQGICCWNEQVLRGLMWRRDIVLLNASLVEQGRHIMSKRGWKITLMWSWIAQKLDGTISLPLWGTLSLICN